MCSGHDDVISETPYIPLALGYLTILTMFGSDRRELCQEEYHLGGADVEYIINLTSSLSEVVLSDWSAGRLVLDQLVTRKRGSEQHLRASSIRPY